MPTVAVLSLHTSPLIQPGSGDGGGMNVYVRELSSALTRAGIACEVFTRAWRPGLAPVVTVEPGLRVHHLKAGPAAPLSKEKLPALLDELTAAAYERLCELDDLEVIHAHYWISGVVGHQLKHELGLPLVSTFHTLARVKAQEVGPEPEARATAEAEVIGCSDVITASCPQEAAQLVQLYGADPGHIEIVTPGVDHAFFSPGPQAGARSALGLPSHMTVLLFVGRIQPLKGADVAIRALAALGGDGGVEARGPGGREVGIGAGNGTAPGGAILLVVGGPSGIEGEVEAARLHALVDELGLHRLGPEVPGVGAGPEPEAKAVAVVSGADPGRGWVRFVDPQPHHLLSTYYRAADVCLMPSRSESFGLVALEAAACGVPVVASKVGGLHAIVEPGRTGFLLDERDPEVYASHVRALLRDPQRAAIMGQRAAERARNYTWSTTAGRLRRLYTDLAGCSGCPVSGACSSVS